ncbi:hypothetical protein ScalyP_jg11619 [Parmales sp. scaly parma]|nr:hypothetical protein ScalyP_jg11619 [Parmales sp. scaly parma]
MYEASIPFTIAQPRPSPHPFGQIPCLVDNTQTNTHDGIVLFESGAILLHLYKEHSATPPTPAEYASALSWVMWANACLDGICFKENENGQVTGTSLDRPNKRIDVLEAMLAKNDYILGGDQLTVADVAVASYLNYVPLFNRNVNLSKIPNIVKYMKRTAERAHFGEAFGEGHQQLVVTSCDEWLSGGGTGGGFKTPKLF